MSREEDRLRRELGLPSKAGMEMYNSLRYCGTCEGGPLLYGDGTCPRCKQKGTGVKFEERLAKDEPAKPRIDRIVTELF